MSVVPAGGGVVGVGEPPVPAVPVGGGVGVVGRPSPLSPSSVAGSSSSSSSSSSSNLRSRQRRSSAAGRIGGRVVRTTANVRSCRIRLLAAAVRRARDAWIRLPVGPDTRCPTRPKRGPPPRRPARCCEVIGGFTDAAGVRTWPRPSYGRAGDGAAGDGAASAKHAARSDCSATVSDATKTVSRDSSCPEIPYPSSRVARRRCIAEREPRRRRHARRAKTARARRRRTRALAP